MRLCFIVTKKKSEHESNPMLSDNFAKNVSETLFHIENVKNFVVAFFFFMSVLLRMPTILMKSSTKLKNMFS